MPLLLADLAQITRGKIHFDRMPPLAGQWAAIERIVLDSQLARVGDLFWRLPEAAWQTPGSTQHALFCGAAGVLVPAGEIAAWPGRFCLEVDDPVAALERLLQWLGPLETASRRESDEPAEKNRLELKDLQLCRYRGLDKTPPTCGRSGGERFSACRRAA